MMTKPPAAALAAVTIVAALAAACAPAAAQDATIAGVWHAREGTPSGMAPGVTSSDVQTLILSADGRYRREILVEGGNGRAGAAGKIVDSGEYRFTPPKTFQYRRLAWVVCTYAACLPGQPIGPNSGTLPFTLKGKRQANFLGLAWTKTQ
jgi:hypothetical protein